MKKLGFIVNPVAGIGGKVGLKGSDGAETLAKALALGAKPESAQKAKVTLEVMKEVADQLEIYTYPGEMGADIVEACGMKAHILGHIQPGATTPEDTMRAAQELRDANLDLILFAGGDGTARNIMDAVGESIPVLGIPAGCKIHSAVYAVNPRTAGELMTQFVQGKVKETREAEVMDIDEDLFRQGIVQARLYGYLRVPNERKMVQNLKSGKGFSESASVEMMANYIADTLEPDTLYIIGPGSTTRAIMEKINLPNTLLGVDLIYNRELVASDVTEKQILAALAQYDKVKIVVTIIGGQGYLFGRGNQQISAEVITRVGKENIIIVAAKNKMLELFGQNLYVDTGNEEVNKMLTGYYRIVVGYEDYTMFKVTC